MHLCTHSLYFDTHCQSPYNTNYSNTILLFLHTHYTYIFIIHKTSTHITYNILLLFSLFYFFHYFIYPFLDIHFNTRLPNLQIIQILDYYLQIIQILDY